MFLSRAVRANLNRRHWDRKVWEIGYRGPLLPQQKATGRPDYPVSEHRVQVLRERLAREYDVMKMLAKPFVSKEVEQDYFAHLSVEGLDDIREKEIQKNEAMRMPGKAKRVEGSKQTVRRRANVGNLLQTHVTVEDSLAHLVNRNRWD